MKLLRYLWALPNTLSGLFFVPLAFFTISRMTLRIEVAQGNKHAERVLALRKDSNILLVNILWCHVGVYPSQA